MYVCTGILKSGIETRHGQFLCTVDLLVMELLYVPGVFEFLRKRGSEVDQVLVAARRVRVWLRTGEGGRTG